MKTSQDATFCPRLRTMVRGFRVVIPASKMHYPARGTALLTGEEARDLMERLKARSLDSHATSDGEEISLDEMQSYFPK